MMNTVIDYLLNNGVAEIPKRGRKELKQKIRDGRKFRYNKAKEISNVLIKNLNQSEIQTSIGVMP